MSKKLLIVLSSVRSGRAADNILTQVQEQLKNYDFEVTVADFKQTPLPFFDQADVPSSEGFAPTDKNVLNWTKQVAEADTVLILAAEYNHSFTAVLKTAIDWVYEEWRDKPVAFIGYGWAGGARAINHLHGVFDFLKPKLIEPEANLRFTKEIDMDGTALNGDAATVINEVLTQL